MENRAVEIRAEDLVRRPVEGAVKAAAGKTWNPVELIKQFKEGLKLVQELAAQAQSMGININLPGLRNLENKVVNKISAAQEPQVDQYRAFVNLLIVRYGDITLNEVFEKLRQDMGNKKLSQIGR